MEGSKEFEFTESLGIEQVKWIFHKPATHKIGTMPILHNLSAWTTSPINGTHTIKACMMIKRNGTSITATKEDLQYNSIVCGQISHGQCQQEATNTATSCCKETNTTKAS